MQRGPHNRGQARTAARWLVWLTLSSLGIGALPAFAADKKSVAAKYAAEGAARTDRAQFKEAAAAYLKAWKADPQAEYLWLLAQAETSLEQKENALEHYRVYVATPGAEPRKIALAREYIDLIEPSSLRARIRAADNAAAAGNQAEASKLYWVAYELARQRWDALLFKVAVAEQESQQIQAAIGHFEEYLKHSTPLAPERPEAITRLENLRKQVRGEAVVPTQQVLMDAAYEESRTLGKTLLYVGGALVLVGAGSYWWTYNDQSRLEGLLQPGANGKITAISRQEARSQVTDANTHVAVAATMGGLGLVAAGVGTYLLLRPAPQVALSPGPGTAGLAVSWRF